MQQANCPILALVHYPRLLKLYKTSNAYLSRRTSASSRSHLSVLLLLAQFLKFFIWHDLGSYGYLVAMRLFMRGMRNRSLTGQDLSRNRSGIMKCGFNRVTAVESRENCSNSIGAPCTVAIDFVPPKECISGCRIRPKTEPGSEKTQSPQDKDDHQNDQPDGQRANEQGDHRQHQSDVGKL
jgi:hypothetical protein